MTIPTTRGPATLIFLDYLEWSAYEREKEQQTEKKPPKKRHRQRK